MRRQEELDEMRQHLTAAIKAHEELGLGTELATQEVLFQFEQARDIGADL